MKFKCVSMVAGPDESVQVSFQGQLDPKDGKIDEGCPFASSSQIQLALKADVAANFVVGKTYVFAVSK